MENRRPGRRNCRETRSEWKIGRVEVAVEEERDEEKLDLDRK